MIKPNLKITGSRGVIGNILSRHLSEKFDVYGLDRIHDDGGWYTQADISDLRSLANAFRDMGGSRYLIHLAGDPQVGAHWDSVLRNNIIGTRNVYQCARIFQIEKVVFASSNHVTGAYEGNPPTLHTQADPEMISIQDPIRPDSDYGASKAFGEALARQYYELHGIQSVCLRIGTVLADDDPTKDPRHLKTWLSHTDLVQLVEKSLESDVGYGIYYGVSDNQGRFWDISNAEEEIGYKPVSDASELV